MSKDPKLRVVISLRKLLLFTIMLYKSLPLIITLMIGGIHIFIHNLPTSTSEYLWVIGSLIVIYLIVKHILRDEYNDQ